MCRSTLLQTYLIEQQLPIDTLADLINRAIRLDRHLCKPSKLTNRHRSISFQTYRTNSQVSIDGDKKVLFERWPVGDYFKTSSCPRQLSTYAFTIISVAQQAIVAAAATLLLLIITIDIPRKKSHFGQQQLSIHIISDLLLTQQPSRECLNPPPKSTGTNRMKHYLPDELVLIGCRHRTDSMQPEKSSFPGRGRTCV